FRVVGDRRAIAEVDGVVAPLRVVEGRRVAGLAEPELEDVAVPREVGVEVLVVETVRAQVVEDLRVAVLTQPARHAALARAQGVLEGVATDVRAVLREDVDPRVDRLDEALWPDRPGRVRRGAHGVEGAVEGLVDRRSAPARRRGDAGVSGSRSGRRLLLQAVEAGAVAD